MFPSNFPYYMRIHVFQIIQDEFIHFVCKKIMVEAMLPFLGVLRVWCNILQEPQES